jgi:uncharacterized protein
VVGRFGFADGKQPYLIPVTYTFDGLYIYGQTIEGTKLKILRKNSAVCLEVEMMVDMRNWQSVLVIGKFEELEDKQAFEARKILFSSVFY